MFPKERRLYLVNMGQKAGKPEKRDKKCTSCAEVLQLMVAESICLPCPKDSEPQKSWSQTLTFHLEEVWWWLFLNAEKQQESLLYSPHLFHLRLIHFLPILSSLEDKMFTEARVKHGPPVLSLPLQYRREGTILKSLLYYNAYSYFI